MSTVNWAMLPRATPRAAVRSAGRGARALLVAFGLALLSGCNVELFGNIWVPPTQHPVGHLLGFVVAIVVVGLVVCAITDLVRWIAERARHHAHPPGRRLRP